MRPAAARRWLLAWPIHAKVASMAAAMLALVGLATLIAVEATTQASLEDALASEAETLVQALVVQVEGPLLSGEEFEVHDLLERITLRQEDVAYVRVLDSGGQELSRAGEGPDPPRVLPRTTGGPEVRLVELDGTLIADAVAPVLGGRAGYAQIGRTEVRVAATLERSRRIHLLVLALGLTVAVALALVLSWFLTRPIYDLLSVVQRVRHGDLSARVEVSQGDELGELSHSFNAMVDSLETSREQLERKERAREALLEQVIRAEEEERGRLARELHDGLGQSLSALLLELRMRESADPAGPQAATGLAPRLELTIEEVRRMSRGLWPSILDDYGLDSALARYAKELSDLSELQVDCETAESPEVPGRLDRSVEVALYRIAQEALHNVVHHSGASRASVVLYKRSDEVRLIVDDDGRGFEPRRDDTHSAGHDRGHGRGRDDGSGNGAGHGIGLLTMSERARLLGGEVSIESTPGSGTVVRATIPLEDQGARS